MSFLLESKPVVHWLFLLFIILSLSLISCDSEKAVMNHTNKVRLVSLAPHITELSQSAGATRNLVGMVSHTDSTSHEFDDIPVVGDAFKLDYEAIIALKPDYILSWRGGTPVFVIEKLRSLKLNLVEIEINSLADISEAITRIAALTGTHEQARINVKTFQAKLTALKNQNHQHRTVFIQTYDKPLYTVSAKHWMSEAASICGYENIFQTLPQLSATVSLEAVISKDPQSIIVISQAADEQWQKWLGLAAVRNKQIINIPPDYFSRPSMQLLQGITALCDY